MKGIVLFILVVPDIEILGVGLLYNVAMSFYKWRACRDASGRVIPINPHVCVLYKHKFEEDGHFSLSKVHPWTQKKVPKILVNR